MEDEMLEEDSLVKELKTSVKEFLEKKEEISIDSGEVVEEEPIDKLQIQEMNLDDCTVIDICNVVPLIPVVLGMKCKMKDSKEIINIGVPGFINKESGSFFSFDGKSINADGFDYHLDKILKGGTV